MGGRARAWQIAAVVVFVATAFLPAQAVRQHPSLSAAAAPSGHARGLRGAPRDEVPAGVLAEACCANDQGPSFAARLWEARRWYPHLLAPLWLLALLLVLGTTEGAERRRRVVGTGVLALSVGLAALEACYLGLEYVPLLPRLLGRAEVLLAWLVVVLVLAVRRRPDRRRAAVEAHVASQALLGALHLITLPASQARGWLGDYPVGAVLSAVTENFRPGFWLGLAALLFVVGSALLARRPRLPAAARGGAGESEPALLEASAYGRQ